MRRLLTGLASQQMRNDSIKSQLSGCGVDGDTLPERDAPYLCRGRRLPRGSLTGEAGSEPASRISSGATPQVAPLFRAPAGR